MQKSNTRRFKLTGLLITILTLIYTASSWAGELVAFQAKTDSGISLQGVKVYAFTEQGAYTGKNGTTDTGGYAFFFLPVDESFKFRADYLGYQYWSDRVKIATDTEVRIAIPHKEVSITVAGGLNSPSPISGIRVYLYSASGSYMNRYLVTDAKGMVSFSLPEKGYKFRADYLNQHYWSGEILWQDSLISIPMAEALVSVSGSGFPLPNVKIYAFSQTGSYLNLYKISDGSGNALFILPAGAYKFRADYQGSNYWSDDQVLIANENNPVEISTGGGVFELSVLKDGATPLGALKCYVFTEQGSYIGLSGVTDQNGKVSFNLSDGRYRFRIDYLGYSFWSNICEIPASLSDTLVIPHNDVTIHVSALFQGSVEAMQGIKVYLFNSNNSYMNHYRTTDLDGNVIFNLPEARYKARADYLGRQYWSEESLWEERDIRIHMGEAVVQVLDHNEPLENVRVYVFSETASYLNIYRNTGLDGKVSFQLPEGKYKFRADFSNDKFWSDVINLTGDQSQALSISNPITWEKIWGDSSSQDIGNDVIQAQDGGYVVVGTTNRTTNNDYDILLMKFDRYGQVSFQKIFSHPGYDQAMSVQQTRDGGYILAGHGINQSYNKANIVVIKTSASGELEWQEYYGGGTTHAARSIAELHDNGYIIAGHKESFIVNVGQRSDIFLLKIDESGNEIWQKTYGGPDDDAAYTVQQTSDLGYMIGGFRGKFKQSSEGIDCYHQGILIKTDPDGEEEWRTIHGPEESITTVKHAQQTDDKGYIVLLGGPNSTSSSELVKLDEAGDEAWSLQFSDQSDFEGASVEQTADKGYIVAGKVDLVGRDIKLIKVNSNGTLEWETCFGDTTQDEFATSVKQTRDSGYIVLGKQFNSTNNSCEIFLIKTDAGGNVIRPSDL